jgi:ornithine cyclodeaminase
MRLISNDEIPRALPMRDAVRLMGEAFAAITEGRVSTAQRQVLEIGGGHALLMGATAAESGFAGKLMTVIPGNRGRNLPVSSGLAMLLSEHDGQSLVLMDATQLTAWRTAAAAGFAIDLLARPDAAIGLMIGCGTQAAAQVVAMDTVRGLREIRVLGRSPKNVAAFVERMQPRVRAGLTVPAREQQALQDVDIITAATTSTEPVIEGANVPPGCHVSGVGSFRAGMCEFDVELISRAAVFVESRSAAREEAGELIAANAAGVSDPKAWSEVGEVVAGRRPGRTSDEQITFYKSVGQAAFDLYAARAIYRAAQVQDMGMEWAP